MILKRAGHRENPAPHVYEVACRRCSTNQEFAKQFMEFMKGSDGQEIMRRYGFTLPN